MKIKNVLFVVSEAQNFAVTGGLADVAGSLPNAINKEQATIKMHVIMPLYKQVFSKYEKQLKHLGTKTVKLSWRKQEMSVYTLHYNDVDYYFIKNDYYFNRENLYGYEDDIERYAFFSRAVINSFKILGFTPDIIHSHDWQAALVNVYLSLENKRTIKTILTIHNIEYQGIFAIEHLEDLTGISHNHLGILEYNGVVNLLKAGIVSSDYFTTVSRQYAREIQTAEFGKGLENIINQEKHKLVGIINGIDYDFYNPETDPHVIKNYSSEDLSGKLANKLYIQKDLNLDIDKDIPLIVIISRLVSHKGIDIILPIVPKILALNAQIVVLGTGDSHFENEFSLLASKFPNQMKSLIKFDIALAKQLYAAADLFLMPSATEPCGLSQMIASRYAAVPIVRKTGGLADSITDYQLANGNGFVFSEYSSDALLAKITEAIDLFKDEDKFKNLVDIAINTDFSWSRSAKEYIKLYADTIF